MKFYSLKDNPPADGTWCLLRREDGYVQTQPRQYFEDETTRLETIGYVEYAVLPPHCADDPSGWLSEYWDDELPEKDASCLVCTSDRKRMPFYAYFNAEQYRFMGGCDEAVFAYRYI